MPTKGRRSHRPPQRSRGQRKQPLSCWRTHMARWGFLLRNVTDYLLNRFDDLRNWRRGYGHFWKAGEGIAVFILVGILLTLGMFAAMAATGSDTESAYVPSTPSTEVVTQTIKRKGKTLRVVHHRTSRGDVVLRTVTGHGTTVQRPLVTMPARTVRETHTVTTQEIATVTEDQPVTVTVFETVTVKPCKPKSC